MSEWIEVEEDSPIHEIDCLIWVKKQFKEDGDGCYKGFCSYLEGAPGEWFYEDGNPVPHDYDFGVTHWMPLPAPPLAKGEG